MNKTKFLHVQFFSSLLFASLCISSFAWASPTTLTYQGRIVRSDGSPLIYDNVSFIFKITDPAGACVIYQEQFSGYDMTNSKGIFDVAIGTGSVIFPADGSLTVLDVFNNSQTFACNGGGGATYTPGISDGRKLRVQFHDGIGWQTITPDSTIRSVPFAGYAVSARKLGSYSATDFLLKAGLPTCAADTFLTWDGSHLTCLAASGGGGGGGTVTSVTSTNSYITVANNTTTAQMTLNVGTGANTVAAGNDSRIVNALQTGGAASGDLSGSYPSPQVVALRGVGVSNATPSSGNYLKYDGSNWAPSAITVSEVSGLSTQLGNKIDASQMPANCGVNQTLAFSSPTGTWTCNNISVSQWTTTGSNIYYSTGKVGIGTSSPSQALSVAGTIESTSGGFKFPDGTTQTTAGGGISGTVGRLAKFSGTGSTLADSLIQETSSVVGVGIAPDAYNFSSAALRTGNIQMGNTSNYNNQDYYLVAGANTTTVPVANTLPYALISSTAYQNFNIVGIGGSADANSNVAAAQQLRFFTNSTFNSTTYNERMRIDPNGNVGIGTNSPGQLLSVAGTIESTTGGFKFPDGTVQTTSATGTSIWSTSGSNIYYGGTGNVGIGTSSPSQTLEVASSSQVPLITSTGSYGGNYVGGGFLAQGLPRANGYFAFDTANEWFSGIPYGGSGYAINYKSTSSHTNAVSDITGIGGSSNYFYISTSGKVGIGTTNPSYNLHVVGNAGLSSGTSWTNASDIRLKDIKGDYEYGLDEVLRLHTVRYNYKKDNPLRLPADVEKTGFIAQEVQAVIPDAVKTRSDGYLELNVDPIHWAVVNAIQDLYKKYILSLQEENKQQAQEIESLKKRLDAQEKEMVLIKNKLGM